MRIGPLAALVCLAWLAGPPSAQARRQRPAPPPPAPAGESGVQIVGATPGADVYIDGEKIGTTPLPRVLPSASGEHTVRVARPGFAPFLDVFKVRDGRVTRIEVELVPVSGVLRLSANVERARVFIDEQFVGDAPIEADLKTGPHTLRVTRFGYRDETLRINAVAGEVLEQRIALGELPPGENPYKPLPPPPPRWYERWWVWTAGAAGVAGLAVAIIVPTVLASRPACQKLAAEVCITVPAPAEARMLLLGGSF